MRNLQITIPEGYEIDKELSTFENIVFKPTVVALPKTWEELKEINGYCTTSVSKTTRVVGLSVINDNCNVFATKEQAEACIALAQLSQLMQVYNDGWVPNWKDGDWKYNIEGYEDKFLIENRSSWISFLTFKTRPLAETFLENFKDLITIAKPLL